MCHTVIYLNLGSCIHSPIKRRRDEQVDDGYDSPNKMRKRI